MRWTALAFAALALGALWHAAPARDARAFNDRIDRECAYAQALARSEAFFERGRYTEPPQPAVCARAPEREQWETQWLLIAAVLGVGAGVVGAVARR